jgi:hypothetical protein
MNDESRVDLPCGRPAVVVGALLLSAPATRFVTGRCSRSMVDI